MTCSSGSDCLKLNWLERSLTSTERVWHLGMAQTVDKVQNPVEVQREQLRAMSLEDTFFSDLFDQIGYVPSVTCIVLYSAKPLPNPCIFKSTVISSNFDINHHFCLSLVVICLLFSFTPANLSVCLGDWIHFIHMRLNWREPAQRRS